MKNSKTIRFILWNVSVLIEMWNENGLFNVHIKSIYICTFNSYQLTDHLSCIYDRDIHKIQHNTERGTKKKDKKNYNKLWIAFSILYTHRHTKTLSIPIRTNEKKKHWATVNGLCERTNDICQCDDCISLGPLRRNFIQCFINIDWVTYRLSYMCFGMPVWIFAISLICVPYSIWISNRNVYI